MSKTVKRGYFPNDEIEFSGASIEKLHKAACDLYYLINQGYHVKTASVFVGNHYLLSERQRLALVRTVSSKENIKIRKNKEIKECLEGRVVNIDGFNTIITLEVALSGSTLLNCMDGTIRDLAGLRGTYRLIDKTEVAIACIGKALEEKKIRKAVFYLDAPVSNSGRLKEQIIKSLQEFHFDVEVNVIHNVDSVLEKLDNVVTSDAIILDKCKSWFNLTKGIIAKEIGEYPYINWGVEYENDMNHYIFSQNSSCEYFPCHKTNHEEKFNCLFCYCPLYVLKDKCGGSFKYLENGVKDCSDCLIPHDENGYEHIISHMGEVMELGKKV